MKTNNRWFHFVIPFLIQLGILGVCMVAHRITVALGDFTEAQVELGGQLTKPTLGRLCFLCVAAVLFIVLSVIASKSARNGKTYLPFILGNFAGTFLWQVLGEDVWHFSVNGVHFVQLESITALPIVIVFVIMLAYFYKNKGLDWGVLCMVLSFSINWYGHYLLECTCILFEGLIESGTFMKIVGSVLGVTLMTLGIIRGLGKEKTEKQRILYSMLCFFAMALIAFGFIG